MKILLTGSNISYGLTMSYLRAFREMRVEVKVFDDEGLYKELFPSFKNKYFNRLFWKLFSLPLQRKFIEIVEREKPDLTLVLKGWFFNPKTLMRIKENVPTTTLFCFNPDNPFNTWHFGSSNSWIRRSISLYDCYFIWGKFLIDGLKRAGAKRVEYLSFGYDLYLHYPVEVSEEERKVYGAEVAFIGSWDKEREWWLNHLLGYDLKIWGNSWERANKNLRKRWQGRAVTGEEFSKVCNSSKIIINLIRKQNIPAHNMKTFEIPACGGFVLSIRTDEVKSFFEEDKEIVCFYSPEELKKKINFYLKREDLRKEIARRAHEKVRSHTYLKKAKRILKIYEEFRR